METITIYLTPDQIKDKVITLKVLSALGEYTPEESGREGFPVYLSNESNSKVAVNVSFDTFYSLTRLCQIHN